MIGTYDIGLATPREVPLIAAMSRELIEQGLGWRWTPAAITHSLRDRATNVAVARGRTALAGFGIMRYLDAEAHLLLFAVAPPHRRRGVGAALLAWLEDTARTAGIELVFLEARATNETARHFYAAQGYRELARLRRYYSGREDAVRLGKDLSDGADPPPVP